MDHDRLQISIDIDGETVTGEIVSLAFNDFDVRINNEFRFVGGVHIPYFALGHARYVDRAGLITPHLTSSAQSQLVLLHRASEFVRSHVSRMRARWPVYESRIESIRLAIAANELAVRDVRHTFRPLARAGRAQKEYQRALHALSNARQQLEQQVSAVTAEFIAEFPTVGVVGQQVIQMLKGRPTERR